MAIDTENKRRSVMGFSHPSVTLPLPDGDISESDRATIVHNYAGIDYTPGVPTLLKRRRQEHVKFLLLQN